ncbi:cellulase family glycosylhydrolase [Flavitalea antarctica]
MSKFKQKALFITILTMMLTGTITQATPFRDFITRKGDRLYDGQKIFRFVGVNAPNINGHYDGYKNTNPESGYVYDPIELSFEMESYFKDMAQMGVTVFRNWGITVSDGSNEYESLVTGPNTYNETAFRRIDKMLELCNKYNIRVILCLVKENRFWGGTDAFSKLHGGGNYYTDPAPKQGFKQLLDTMVRRINYYTGKAYKDDKSILAWEFGNEVPNSQVEWINEMANYLKKIDPHHLIADPRRANGVEQLTKLVDDVLNRCKNIDFVKTRQYPNYKGTVDELWAVCAGRIPMIIDEFQEMDRFTGILERVQQTGTSGALLWSLMKYQYKGGIGGHALFHSYSWGGSRWPGFNSGAYFNEEKNLHQIRNFAYKIRDEKVPPLPAPEGTPFLFNSSEKNAAALKWRGTPGARYYVVERASSRKGPWKDVSGDIDISFDLYFYPMFTDSSATTGSGYYYRVRGKNASGITNPSNVIGPVKVNKRIVMDNLLDFSRVYRKSSNLTIGAETYPRLRQTEEDFAQVERLPGTGSGELIYAADELQSIAVVVFNDKPDSLKIQWSADGASWTNSPPLVTCNVREGYLSMISGEKDHTIGKFTYEVPAFPAGTRFVKLTTGNDGAADTYPWIGRVHIGFKGKLTPPGK